MKIDEFNIRLKPRKGTGTYKDMYFLDTRPDLIIKAFDRESNESIYDVKDEEEIGKKYPELFATIVKINYNKGWLVQEKLNTETFLSDVNNLSSEISKAVPHMGVLDIVAYLFDRIKDKDTENIKTIYSLLKDSNNKKFYKELISYLNKIKHINSSTRPSLDSHKDNFGYDKYKKIKMLDI